jgi:hypothetical protein
LTWLTIPSFPNLSLTLVSIIALPQFFSWVFGFFSIYFWSPFPSLKSWYSPELQP